MPPSTALDAISCWQLRPDPAAFPYDDVVSDYHRDGKHFVPRELLLALHGVRGGVPAGCPAHRTLACFLSTALDKFDGRYDNPSFLALEQLGLPGADGCPDPARAQRTRDRLLALLLADMLRFELEALDGRTGLFPQMRPDRRRVEKRCRHALRALRPVLERQRIAVPAEVEPIAAARAAAGAVLETASPEELRTLQLTAIPVSQVHDEYMFIRALQAYEVTFAAVAVQLGSAVEELAGGSPQAAADLIGAAAEVVGESSPLWSLTATMQTESFLTFREFTDGASAIQSRNYKRLESLCRRPDAKRLDSPAYTSVPEVRDAVIAGQATVADAVWAAGAEGLLGADEKEALAAAMERFEAAILKWRKTHHSIAARMLGERRGTGYTEGVGYLAEGRTIPVFQGRCPLGHDAVPEGVASDEHLAPA